MHELATAIKREARRLGSDLCRIVPAAEADHSPFFRRWLGLGRAGEMGYLARNVEKRTRPALLAESGDPFRSLIVLGVDYHRFDLPPSVLNDPARGVIARYAWGDDYHEIIRPLLHELDAFIRAHSGRATLGKALVDTGPVLERDWAMAAGIGFTGKNCCTIHPQRGSWLFLATLLVPEELPPDPPPVPVHSPQFSPEEVADGLPPTSHLGAWQLPDQKNRTLIHTEKVDSHGLRSADFSFPGAYDDPGSTVRAKGNIPFTNLESPIPNPQSPISNTPIPLATCGRCTRCMDACPTDAFVGPFHLDPQRCISYWTIESRQPIPQALRPLFGNRIFGCDICQEVCPWNGRLPERTPLLAGLAAQSERVAPALLEGFGPENPYWLEQDAFSRRFRRSPIKRAKRAGMLRNVCVALGNWADPSALDGLALALNDSSALGRGHAAWALGEILQRHRLAQAAGLLQARQAVETDEWVRSEIGAALM